MQRNFLVYAALHHARLALPPNEQAVLNAYARYPDVRDAAHSLALSPMCYARAVQTALTHLKQNYPL